MQLQLFQRLIEYTNRMRKFPWMICSGQRILQVWYRLECWLTISPTLATWLEDQSSISNNRAAKNKHQIDTTWHPLREVRRYNLRLNREIASRGSHIWIKVQNIIMTQSLRILDIIHSPKYNQLTVTSRISNRATLKCTKVFRWRIWRIREEMGWDR